MPWKHQDLKFLFLHLALVYTRMKTAYSKKIFSFIAAILGWFLYCSIIHKTGSSMWSISTDRFTNGGIFKFETALVKKLLQVLAILPLFSNMELSSTKVILIDLVLFFRKQWFNMFPKKFIVNIFGNPDYCSSLFLFYE